ncbi:DUF547 domain-containing protein [Alteromonas sp. A079]|uniref:DUF547 domain-containing protein n=1 Tax=Alteromonas sp. A079 TaxID=3410268 RepID=UPI003BA38FF8
MSPSKKWIARRWCKRLLASSLLLAVGVSHASDTLHAPFTALLNDYVVTIEDGASTQVDYAGFNASKASLNTYLATLASVSQATFDGWDNHTQLAFLINAYNAYTINFILTRYPDLDSIRDLGGFFSSPWKQEIAPLLGDTRTLDEIEHTLIRGGNKYNEPRIHFAVNCASIGCPALREEAYLGSELDAQLDDQTIRFLSDPSRNYMKGDTLYISKIFDWYGDDFSTGWKGANSLNDFLLLYKNALKLSESQQKQLVDDEADVKFLDYNWLLNSKPK